MAQQFKNNLRKASYDKDHKIVNIKASNNPLLDYGMSTKEVCPI